MTGNGQHAQRILLVAALGEALTGLAALLAPKIVITLLFRVQPDAVAVLVARVLGTALVGLAAACWPTAPAPAHLRQQSLAMLIYGAAVAAVLAYGATIGATGKLLWPAVALHVIVSILLGFNLCSGPSKAHAEQAS